MIVQQPAEAYLALRRRDRGIGQFLDGVIAQLLHERGRVGIGGGRSGGGRREEQNGANCAKSAGRTEQKYVLAAQPGKDRRGIDVGTARRRSAHDIALAATASTIHLGRVS